MRLKYAHIYECISYLYISVSVIAINITYDGASSMSFTRQPTYINTASACLGVHMSIKMYFDHGACQSLSQIDLIRMFSLQYVTITAIYQCSVMLINLKAPGDLLQLFVYHATYLYVVRISLEMCPEIKIKL